MLFLQSHLFIASHTARVRANKLGCDIILMYANCAKITPTKSQAIIHQHVSPMCPLCVPYVRCYIVDKIIEAK